MPRKPHRIQRFLFQLFVFSLASWALKALRGGPSRDEDEVEFLPASGFQTPTVSGRVKLEHWEDGRVSPVRRRAALAMVFTTLFFAGAAFTAGAGDQASKLLDQNAEATSASEATAAPQAEQPAAAEAETPAAEPEATPEATPEAAPEATPEATPAPEAAPEATPEAAPAPEATPEATPEAAPETAGSNGIATDAASEDVAPARATSRRPSTGSAPERKPAPKARPKRKPAPPQASAEQEAAAHGGAAVIWLSRSLPDPTPPARRLSPSFAKGLVSASRKAKANWALVLGVLRAQGNRGRVPASLPRVRRLARQLHANGSGRDAWGAALAVMGSTDGADQAVALARYNRAVGMRALVRGLEAEKANLVKRVLRDRRVEIYAGGRNDLMLGRIDVRVVALMRYLAESFGQVRISCLFSGHRLYARPGVVSAHIYGHAVDIASLGGLSITGHQEPGGLTEQAVRAILLLPAEVQPRQVISLLGLGGASFPLADHNDHIHVGY